MVRYGILGFGLHAAKRLMPGFALAKNSTVTALSRRGRDKAEASAREFGIAHGFGSAEELCACSEVDAIFVATPNFSHRNDARLALHHGKAVLCEKPMAMNAGEALEMVDAARDRELPLGIAQVFRFAECTQRLREKIAAGEIGRPVFARSEFSFVGGREHARTWLYDRAVAGGGPIADIGVHCIDTLRFILQDDVLRVSAVGQRDKLSGTVEAAATLSLEFRRGTLATVLVSFRANYRTPLEFVGEGGVLFADDGLNVEHPITIERRSNGELTTENVSNHLAYARQVDAFSETVERGTPFAATGEDGLENQLILDAAYRSLESGRAENVKS